MKDSALNWSDQIDLNSARNFSKEMPVAGAPPNLKMYILLKAF